MKGFNFLSILVIQHLLISRGKTIYFRRPIAKGIGEGGGRGEDFSWVEPCVHSPDHNHFLIIVDITNNSVGMRHR